MSLTTGGGCPQAQDPSSGCTLAMRHLGSPRQGRVMVGRGWAWDPEVLVSSAAEWGICPQQMSEKPKAEVPEVQSPLMVKAQLLLPGPSPHPAQESGPRPHSPGDYASGLGRAGQDRLGQSCSWQGPREVGGSARPIPRVATCIVLSVAARICLHGWSWGGLPRFASA